MGLRNHAGLAVTTGAITAAMLAASACGGPGGTAAHGRKPGAATPSPYDASRLKGALLTTYEQARRAAPASAGTVGALQNQLGLAKQLSAIKTRERNCLTAGPNLISPTLRTVPASAVTLADTHRGYTLGEVLFSTDAKSLRALVDRPVPASCRHLTAKVKNATIKVAIKPIGMPKAAYPARGLMTTVVAGGRTQRSLTMMFATPKYGGTLSLTGPRATGAVLRHATTKAIQAADHALT